MKEKWYKANKSYNCNHITASKLSLSPFKSICLYHFFFNCLTVFIQKQVDTANATVRNSVYHFFKLDKIQVIYLVGGVKGDCL